MMVPMVPVTSSGPSWTISSGPSVMKSGSALFTAITRLLSGHQRIPITGTRKSSILENHEKAVRVHLIAFSSFTKVL